MQPFLCTMCGTQFEASDAPPGSCPVCLDARQYVNPAGQGWTTLEALRRSHLTTMRELEPGLTGVGMTPKFAIGQRALLLRTPRGNVLWDCIPLLDAAAIAMIRGLGGLAGVAISHPHYYTTMVEWARAFACKVHLHVADREWVMRHDPALQFWEGDETEVLPGVTLLRLGGHFPGASVLHWGDRLLSGDTVQVTPRRTVSFQWSYPNMIPLAAATVERIAARLAGRRFDRVYGAFWESVVPAEGSAVVARSAAAYVRALGGGS